MLKKLRYIFDHKEKLHIAFLLVLIVIGSFFELMGVAVFMPFIYYIMDPAGTVDNYPFIQTVYDRIGCGSQREFIVFLALVIGFIYIIKNLFLIFEQNAILTFSYSTRMNIATKLLATYMREPYTFHLKRNIAESQRALQTDTQQFMLLLTNSLQLMAEGMVVLVIGLFLFETSHAISLVILGMLTLCMLIFYWISKNISGKLGKQNEYYMAKMNQWMNQALGGIKEVKVLHRERFFVDSYEENYKEEIKGAKKNELLAAAPKYVMETVCILGMLLAVVGKILFGQDVAITTFIPQLSAFAVASFRLLPSAGKINAYVASINYCKPSLDNVYNDLRSVEDIREDQNISVDKVADASFSRAIRLDRISYRYPDADHDVINDVTLSIAKGESVALIGESGAGKTTLADIILGLLSPQQGSILVDTWKINENPNAWHKLLGYIPQTIYLTDDTIRNNIAFGIKENEIDDAAIEKAIKQVQLEKFVSELPEGVNTFVGDRGVRISGGQRQRIGIARALYMNPEILVLDEATSALDSETESAVMDAIDSLKGDKTMIIIAHRLTTIRNANRIYEVKDGGIIEKSKDEIGI